MLSNRKLLPYPVNYYLVDTETQAVVHDTGMIPDDVIPFNNIDFIYAGDYLDIDRVIKNSGHVDDISEGEWILSYPKNEINSAWKKIKESIRTGNLWMCRVATSHELLTYRILVAIPKFSQVPTLLETYNHLAYLGLISLNQELIFTTNHALINNKKNDHYTSYELPKLVLQYTNNYGYDKRLPFLMLQYLRNQIAELPLQTTTPSFITALRCLSQELWQDIQNDNELQQLINIKIAAETSNMLINLQKHCPRSYVHRKSLNDSEEAIHSFLEKKIKNEEKINIIKTYENNCRQVPGIEKFMKTIATIIMTGVGMILGATIGMGIGAAIGAVSGGPFAVVTASVGAVMGLIKGTLTGYAVSLVTGSVMGGIATSLTYGRFFFKPTKKEQLVKKVVEEARHHYL